MASFPKPEYIQNFIEEKLKKRSKLEKLPLLNGDGSTKEHGVNRLKNINSKKSKPSSFLSHDGANGHTSSSSVISESDDPNRKHDASYPFEEQSKKRHKSLASDADCETDDSGDKKRRKGSPSTNSLSRKTKKNKDPKPAFKEAEEISSYGGTSGVELNCAEALASYCANEVKSTKSAGSNFSVNTNKKRMEMSYNGYQDSKEYCNNSYEAEGVNGRATSFDHKHNYDSSNSDFGRAAYSRRNSFESDHCHDSSDERSEKDEKKRRKAMRKLMIATGLSFLFMVGEVIGGYLANSLAVLTDASHLLTDVSSFMISILALKMASRPISKKMTFGWHRAEVIGALISVLAIWIVTGVLVYLAVERLIRRDYKVNGKNMLITAGLAVGFNIIMGLVLHEHSHFGHSHGHSHGHHDHNHDHEAASSASGADDDSNDSGNVNVRAAFIHVLGDLLQSLGVMVAAFIIYFKPDYKIADPICTFLFSIFVLITTITILRDTMIIIMEGSPVNIEYNVVKDKLLEIEGVTAVHDLRIWSLTLNQTVMSAHLAIDKYADPNTILKRATRRLKALYDFHSLTIQVEYYSDDMNSCKKCQPASK